MPITLFKKKAFFAKEEAKEIVAAIQAAEKQTSCEIRVYVETKCAYINAQDRAIEIFTKLNMHKTLLKNGVLLYVATHDKQVSLYGDTGIFTKIESEVWQQAIHLLLQHFKANNYVQGFVACIQSITMHLTKHYPYTDGNNNELPDEIVFGK